MEDPEGDRDRDRQGGRYHRLKRDRQGGVPSTETAGKDHGEHRHTKETG